MIEKIPFGGITRRPSDLASKEGNCEESLNVVIDVNEAAPVIEPEDRTEELVGGTLAVTSNTTDRYVYIHKTGSYVNYIALNSVTNEIFAYIEGVKSSALVNLNTLTEQYKNTTSIGNTLIVCTDKNLHYILYKDNSYTYLGTHIPEPMVDFRAVPVATGVGSQTFSETYTAAQTIFTGNAIGEILLATCYNSSGLTPEQAWDQLAAHYGIEKSEDDALDATLAIDSITSFIWDRYYKMRQENINAGVFSSAILVRSALKLYDGSYIYQSVPFLLHCGENTSLDAALIVTQVDNENVAGIQISIRNFYCAKATITYPDLGNWSDIVRSVDIFASTDISNPKVGARVDGAVTAYNATWLRFLGQSESQEFEDVKDEILSKVNFYLMESKEVGEIGASLTVDLKPVGQDELLVRESLLDDNLSHHKISPVDGASSYNSRLVLRGLSNYLYSGHPFLQSTCFVDTRSGVFANEVMEFRYHIRSEDGGSYTVIGRNSTGGQQFTYPVESVGSPATTYYGVPQGFLFYPDPRCYLCEIYYGSAASPAYVYRVPMREHPGLNGAYALCDLRYPVTQAYVQDSGVTAYPSTENRTFEEKNKLVMSEAMNPFSFLLTNRQTFMDAILAVATTTKALSTGQFGQFPLYVFTEGGIWAVPLTDTGSMSSAVPVSRDVALSSFSVTPIDQAIVFVSARGVMILTGSDIQEISPEMIGRHYAIEEDAADLLDDTEWEKYETLLADTTPFMTFMKDARAAYDYTNRRLVFFNQQNATMQLYQYVYQMDTQTWHKTSLLQTGFGSANVLNGYPEALICFKDSGGVFRVCDLSVRYDGTDSQSTLSQVIITRPFNFNLANVSKTIRKLFVRGIYEKGNVKYILLGSPDGINYHVIHSLRGPSNNIFFRVVILGTLTPSERLTYLEMDYEARFTDTPR